MIHRDFAAVTLTTLPSILGLPIVNNTCALSTPVMDVSDSDYFSHSFSAS